MEDIKKLVEGLGEDGIKGIVDVLREIITPSESETKMLADKDRIMEKTDDIAMLELLAEEAAELSQAALKLIRARDNGIPTPVSEEEAQAQLVDEYLDVRLAFFLLEKGVFFSTAHDVEYLHDYRKINRWYKRLFGDEPVADKEDADEADE